MKGNPAYARQARPAWRRHSPPAVGQEACAAGPAPPRQPGARGLPGRRARAAGQEWPSLRLLLSVVGGAGDGHRRGGCGGLGSFGACSGGGVEGAEGEEDGARGGEDEDDAARGDMVVPPTAPASVTGALVHYATSNETPRQTQAEAGAATCVLAGRAPCNLLVFGLGPDAALWPALNHGGRTLFLEADAASKANLATGVWRLETRRSRWKAGAGVWSSEEKRKSDPNGLYRYYPKSRFYITTSNLDFGFWILPSKRALVLLIFD
ncbi:hypothetical protein C2845_PM15G11620 [Panicum miliaceum]|uniref:Uncharacterized protein n=1 Tax=Panicum miliaceum TaxID=4540 RepID=A0A3L6QBN7_PANMI|nr:hypothetical protein C2845_PM15G11620 [Panicum miliaceum]